MTNFLTLQPNALAEYQGWLSTIKQRIASVRLRMALAASRELTLFYWELGAMITQKQAQSQWGDKLIAQLSADLQKAFPDIKGLSASNLKYCLRFFQFYNGAEGMPGSDNESEPFGQQPVDQMPWGHNIQIFTKCSSVTEARFYIEQTLEQGWSRDVLAMQLKSNLYARAGKAVSNFSRTLALPQFAVDSLLKRADDQPTIGLLLCRDKNSIEVEFALRDLNKLGGRFNAKNRH